MRRDSYDIPPAAESDVAESDVGRLVRVWVRPAGRSFVNLEQILQ